MRVFVAGASGAIGLRLVAALAASGHEVVGTTRSAGKVDTLRDAGAAPVVVDVLAPDAVTCAVFAARPEVVVHEATALADASLMNMRKFDDELAPTNRLRTEGTGYLLAAARTAGAHRFVAQSFAGWPFARAGGPVKTESDPLDPTPPTTMRRALTAIRQLEKTVIEAEGIEGVVLRYGALYGPGTSLSEGGLHVAAIRKRRLPLIGDGSGVWSFVHIDDAVQATVAAIECGGRGIYNIVDDEPARVSEWLPALSAAVGARPPRHLPAWLGQLLAGDAALAVMTEARGAANAKAKRELAWQPQHPTWRRGFPELLLARKI